MRKTNHKSHTYYTNKSFCSSLDISATPVISIDLIWPPNRVVNWVSVRPLVSGTTIATKNTPTIKTMAWNPNKCERPKECSIQGYIFRIRATTICLTLRLTEHPTVRPLKSKRSCHATSFIHSKLFWVQWPKNNLLQIKTFKELTFYLGGKSSEDQV